MTMAISIVCGLAAMVLLIAAFMLGFAIGSWRAF